MTLLISLFVFISIISALVSGIFCAVMGFCGLSVGQRWFIVLLWAIFLTAIINDRMGFL